MASPRWIVMEKTLWQGDTWKPSVRDGGRIYTQKKEGLTRAAELEVWSNDLRYVVHTRLVSWTEAKRILGGEMKVWYALVYAEHEEKTDEGSIYDNR